MWPNRCTLTGASTPRTESTVAVDSRSEVDDDVYSFEFDGIDEARPRARTIRVAHQVHLFYDVLVETYDEHGYNRRVARITQRQLERAANALADLIAGLH